MKIELRVPTQDPYAYIGLELADGEVLTDEMIEAAVTSHQRATRRIWGNAGLPEKDFRQFIDNQLSGKSIHIDDYEKMNDYQIFAVQTIKRAKKRT